MEHQAPDSPAEGTEAGLGAAEGQGNQDALQAFPGAEAFDQTPLVQAILAGDTDWLSELLAATSPEQLAATQPVPLLHAAAASNNADAVHLLLDAGLPPAGLDAQCGGAVLASLFEDATIQQQLTGWHLTPLGIAAWLCHADAAAALLATGAALEAYSEDANAQPARQLTPLAVVADDPLPGSSEAVADLLLAFGADEAAVGAAELERCAERCPALASLLQAAQQAPGGAAAGAAAEGGWDSSEEPTPPVLRALLQALLRRNKALLRTLLPHASPRDLGATRPLSLFHAAAVVRDAEAVRLLAAAGAPAAAADSICCGSDLASLLRLSGPRAQLFNGFQGTALALAAYNGDAAVMAALLAAGAAVNQPSPQVPGLVRSSFGLHALQGHQPVTPLEIVARRAKGFSEQPAEALVHLLLAAGADDALAHRQALFDCARGAALLLLPRLQRASEEGRLRMSAEEEDTFYPLLSVATEPDCVPALEHFLGRVLQLPLTQRTLQKTLPSVLLRTAARHGSVHVLQQAAGGPAGEGSQVASVLGPVLAADSPILLQFAAAAGHTEAVQLLLNVGAVPTTQAVLSAIDCGSLGCLSALLRRGPPGFDEPLPQPSDLTEQIYFSHTGRYPCPILATLQLRVGESKVWFGERRPDSRYSSNQAVVHPLDARLLPLVEALVDAGYRHRTFTDVSVSIRGGEPVLRRHFDPLHPVEGDPRLEVMTFNRWLLMAVRRPAWSPVSHSLFMPSFQSAARAVLLVAHRSTAGACGEEKARPRARPRLLGRLPADLLHRIIALAAYPLSAWALLDAAAAQEAAAAVAVAAAAAAETVAAEAQAAAEAQEHSDEAGEQEAEAEWDAGAAEQQAQQEQKGEAAEGAGEAGQEAGEGAGAGDGGAAGDAE